MSKLLDYTAEMAGISAKTVSEGLAAIVNMITEAAFKNP